MTSSVPSQPEARGSGPSDLNLVLAECLARMEALPEKVRRAWRTLLEGFDSLHLATKEMAR